MTRKKEYLIISGSSIFGPYKSEKDAAIDACGMFRGGEPNTYVVLLLGSVYKSAVKDWTGNPVESISYIKE